MNRYILQTQSRFETRVFLFRNKESAESCKRLNEEKGFRVILVKLTQEVWDTLTNCWLRHTQATSVPMLVGCLQEVVSDGDDRRKIACAYHYWRKAHAKLNFISDAEREETTRRIDNIIRYKQDNSAADDEARRLASTMEGLMSLKLPPFRGEKVIGNDRVSTAWANVCNRLKRK